MRKDDVFEFFSRLAADNPHPETELEYVNDYTLLVAVVLSAQATDAGVNKATRALFRDVDTPAKMVALGEEGLKRHIKTIGLFNTKAKNVIALSEALIRDHGGQVPADRDALEQLPGVGRKTANVVMGVMWNAPDGVVVDTHVQRISQRLGWTKQTDPVKIEQDLCKLLPRDKWDLASHVLIFHGRRICFARKPDCEKCGINDTCPSAFRAEKVGRKPPRAIRLPTV